MIVGLVSTYREGSLALGAVRSLLPCCDAIRVLDGPIGDLALGGVATDWSEYDASQKVIVGFGSWASDAEKRTALLERTRGYPAPTWGVVLDGDELLLWGEYLRDQIEFMEQRSRETGEEITGCSLRIVESDGSVAQINARVLRLDLLGSYVHSSYHLRWRNGGETARPNFPLVTPGMGDLPPHAQMLEEIGGALGLPQPMAPELREMQERLEREHAAGWMQPRRPLQGEPHILHRSILRPGSRGSIPRMHEVEHEGLDGTVGVPVETGEGVAVSAS